MGAFTHYRRTVVECWECEEDDFLKFGDEKVCPNCAYVPTRHERADDEQKDAWEQWWAYRRSSDDVSGFTGRNRIRFVGSG